MTKVSVLMVSDLSLSGTASPSLNRTYPVLHMTFFILTNYILNNR
jgi:hypothetical protein